MFYCVKYFSISIMRFKITSALVLHRFMKISLRRIFSRSVSGRPLRKPNNFCISPLASDRLFKAFISLSVKRCLGYLPSNRLRAYALVVSPQRAAYSAISLWSCGVSLTTRRLVYFGASFSIFFLFIPSIASIKSVQPNASLRAFKKSIGIRTNEVRLYDIGISCIALLSVWLYTMMINSLYISRFVLLAKRESIVPCHLLLLLKLLLSLYFLFFWA